jgi:hypothetical protein
LLPYGINAFEEYKDKNQINKVTICVTVISDKGVWQFFLPDAFLKKDEKSSSLSKTK